MLFTKTISGLKMKQKFYSFLHRVLIKKSGYRFRNRLLKKLWQAAWDFSVSSYKGVINYKLHGELVKMNNGYPYPLFINTFYSYNFPLIEIVSQVYRKKNRPIDYVDIGAAIGDTMLLLFQKCPGMIKYFYCIDGDDDFFELLKYNLRNHENGILLKALLSDYDNTKENSLLRTHAGTASSQGTETEDSKTLDELLLGEQKISNIDLIKIDVDGLDGKVISGARKLIGKFKPVIIFEWHPILYHQTGNLTSVPFNELFEQGYSSFIFYNKFGEFSQLHKNITSQEIDFLTQLCLRGKYSNDWHFDIIAIPELTDLDFVQIAEMTYTHQL